MKRTEMKRSAPMSRGQGFKPSEPKPSAGARKRKCGVKGCDERFVPRSMAHKACGPEHAEVIAADIAKKQKAKAQRESRAKDREQGEALKTLPQLLAEAQAVFNLFIRLRDHDKACICCGGIPLAEYLTGGQWDAGHYRSVGSAGHLRFNPDNVHRQRKYCNRDGAGRAVDYRIGLIARIGIERVEALEQDNAVRKWDKDEVRQIRDHYRKEANRLKKLIGERE